jgi:hypothetical protein
MSSEDDDDQNDFIFDDMFGLEATDDGTTDDGQSLETIPLLARVPTSMATHK